MRHLSAAFLFCSALALLPAAEPVAQAAEELPLAAQSRYTETSVDEVTSGNPIKLRIVKDAPSADLAEVTGTFGLSDCVQLGIKNNLRLKQSEEIWLASKFLARAALARFGPAASFNTFYSSSSLNQMLFLPGDTSVASPPMQPIVRGSSLSLMMTFTQPIFTGGRLLGNYKAARALEKQSSANFKEERIKTAFAVKEAYWKAAYSQAKLQVVMDYVKYRQWSSNNLKLRVQEGKSARADFLREEAELARSRVEQNDAYRDFNSELLNLKAAMAINLASVFSLKDALEFVETQGDLSSYLLQSAKERPELSRAASRVAEMKARKMVAMSKYSPQINAYGLGSNITGSSPDGNANGRYGGFIGVMGGVTLFDSGARFNELRAANAAVREAEIAKRDTDLKVAQEVSQAWIDLDLARRNVELAREELASAEEDQRLYHARYQVGKSIALEDFEATVKLFQARLVLLEAIYKYRLAQARLAYTSGGI